MNAYSQAASFLMNPPLVIVQQSSTSTVGTGATAIPWHVKIRDNDGMWVSGSNTRLTIVTPGFWEVRYCLNIGTGGGHLSSYLRVTSGANNPQGAGVAFEWGNGQATEVGTNDMSVCVATLLPTFMYAGDYVTLYGLVGSSTSTTNNTAFSHMSARLVSV
jgi:hypothetical protein